MKRKLRSLVCILLIATLLLALCGTSALAASVPAWINSSKAPIYTKPGETVSLRAGTGVYVTGVKKGWAQINYKDRIGYVQVKYLTAVEGSTGYVKKSSYVYKSASTSSAKRGPLAVGTEVKVVGVNGNFYQVTNGKLYGYIPKGALSKTKPSDLTIMASKVEAIEWSKGSHLFPKGTYAYIYDIQTGAIVHVYREGGTNHAELEPATAEDAAKLFAMGGGKFSWDSRPVILHAGGKYMAAAINTMPQDNQTIKDNNFPGHFCLHLPGSKTHGTDSVNVNHQAAIKYAYAWAKAKAKG